MQSYRIYPQKIIVFLFFSPKSTCKNYESNCPLNVRQKLLRKKKTTYLFRLKTTMNIRTQAVIFVTTLKKFKHKMKWFFVSWIIASFTRKKKCLSAANDRAVKIAREMFFYSNVNTLHKSNNKKTFSFGDPSLPLSFSMLILIS